MITRSIQKLMESKNFLLKRNVTLKSEMSLGHYTRITALQKNKTVMHKMNVDFYKQL